MSGLRRIAALALLQADYPKAQVWVERALAAARELGDKRQIAACLSAAGVVAGSQGNASEAFVAAWERGERLSIDEAVALAYQRPVAGVVERVLQPVPVPQKAEPASIDTLTAREMDVLRLVATGLTNPEIAAHLRVTINTVQTHLRSIFSKINVNTRSAAVRFVFEHSLN